MRELALHYAGRYATTRHKLVRYLERKLRERGWEDDIEPDLEALAERFAELGYVDDAGFAEARTRSMLGRGYGQRRVDEALRAAGVGEADRSSSDPDSDAMFRAALVFARKRQIGPFARDAADPDRRRRQIQACLRAGHDFAVARALVEADAMDAIMIDRLREIAQEEFQ
ncbi:MAG: RecX family transcriptional regulator [Blastomonas sp.]